MENHQYCFVLYRLVFLSTVEISGVHCLKNIHSRIKTRNVKNFLQERNIQNLDIAPFFMLLFIQTIFHNIFKADSFFITYVRLNQIVFKEV